MLSVLASAATSAGWVLNRARATDPSDRAAPAPEPGVVCFGYVDVDGGVAPLYPLIPGRVAGVPVREGEHVKAGKILLRMDDKEARLRVCEAEADLSAAREQLAQALKIPQQHQARLVQQRAAVEAVQHRLEAGREALAHKRELDRIGQINKRDVDVAAAQVRELEALERAEQSKLSELQLDEPSLAGKRAQADMRAKQARLEQAQLGEAECALRAPADGEVLRVLASVGEVLGSHPRQPALLFCPDGPRLIRAEVDQEFAGSVVVGQTARIEDDTAAGPSWHGKVARVSDWYSQRRAVMQEAPQFSDVRTLECLIGLDAGQPVLRIGQRVRVLLQQAAQK
jgi:multidrug resistance efflux pump